MADYTEEQRVKQRWPDAYAIGPIIYCRACKEGHEHELPHPKEFTILSGDKGKIYDLGYGVSLLEAWADASRRLGNEFVDEVGPLAERKEG